MSLLLITILLFLSRVALTTLPVTFFKLAGAYGWLVLVSLVFFCSWLSHPVKSRKKLIKANNK